MATACEQWLDGVGIQESRWFGEIELGSLILHLTGKSGGICLYWCMYVSPTQQWNIYQHNGISVVLGSFLFSCLLACFLVVLLSFFSCFLVFFAFDPIISVNLLLIAC